MEHLEHCFNKAVEDGVLYVAVVIQMDGFSNNEVIINPLDNAESKLEYYKNTYNDDLEHKFSNGIRIVGCTYGKDFKEIEDQLMEDIEI